MDSYDAMDLSPRHPVSWPPPNSMAPHQEPQHLAQHFMGQMHHYEQRHHHHGQANVLNGTGMHHGFQYHNVQQEQLQYQHMHQHQYNPQHHQASLFPHQHGSFLGGQENIPIRREKRGRVLEDDSESGSDTGGAFQRHPSLSETIASGFKRLKLDQPGEHGSDAGSQQTGAVYPPFMDPRMEHHQQLEQRRQYERALSDQSLLEGGGRFGRPRTLSGGWEESKSNTPPRPYHHSTPQATPRYINGIRVQEGAEPNINYNAANNMLRNLHLERLHATGRLR